MRATDATGRTRPSSPRILSLAIDDDPLVNPPVMVRILLRAPIEIVPRGVHLVLLEQAPETGRLIRAFLDRPATESAESAAQA